MKKLVRVVPLKNSLTEDDLSKFYSAFSNLSPFEKPQKGMCFHNARTVLYLENFDVDKYVLGKFRTQDGRELEHAWNKTKKGLYIDVDPNLGLLESKQHCVTYELTKKDYEIVLKYVSPENDYLNVVQSKKWFDIDIKHVDDFIASKKYLAKYYWIFRLSKWL